MHARIRADFNERDQAGRQLVGATKRAGILIKISVVVAGRRPVGQRGLLVDGSRHITLDRDIEAIKSLTQSDRTATGDIDRQLGKAGLQIRTAGIVGRHQHATAKINARVMRDIYAAVYFAVEVRTAQRWRLIRAVANVAAAQIRLELVPRPIRLHPQFRRDGIEPRSLAARFVSRIGIVTPDQFDRRKKIECAGRNAQRGIRIVGFAVGNALFRECADRTDLYRRRTRRSGGDAAGHFSWFIVSRSCGRRGAPRARSPAHRPTP